MVQWITIVFEIIGTIAFAVSGAMAAIESHLDLLGVIILGITTAVGGGMIRDLTLGITPPQAFRHPIYSMIAIAVALLIFISKKIDRSPEKNTIFSFMYFIMDTMGLAVFTVAGITAASQQSAEHGIFLMVFVGVITGVGGGVLRDIMCGNKPTIFVKHFYCTAAIVGAVITSLLIRQIDQTPAMVIGAVVIMALRVLASKYQWELPKI